MDLKSMRIGITESVEFCLWITQAMTGPGLIMQGLKWCLDVISAGYNVSIDFFGYDQDVRRVPPGYGT